MFTGIVEEKGTVAAISKGQHSGVLKISCSTVLEDLKTGDSVAVNGVCLTVCALDGKSFSADVMPETLRRSSLGNLAPGKAVNLERAMAANGRFGGHIVSGHIDGTGTILSMRKEENAIWMRVACEPKLLGLIVEKGSICIDGISLTVAEVGPDFFAVSLIPHTASITTIGTRKAGDTVNLETDLIGKYVQRLLSPAFHSEKAEESSGISLAFLAENGF